MPGLPPELLTHASNVLHDEEPRTGLGLAIVKKIIDEHGGDIRLANRRQGAPKCASACGPRYQSVTSDMAKILIVDDEVGIRELLLEILRTKSRRHPRGKCSCGARSAQRGTTDLVLLDIWMPDTDASRCEGMVGERAADDARRDDVRPRHDRHRGRGDGIGAIDYLEKPIGLQKLLAAVKRGLQRPLAGNAVAADARGLHALGAFARAAAAHPAGGVELARAAAAHRPGSLAELAARSFHAKGAPWLDCLPCRRRLDVNQLQACTAACCSCRSCRGCRGRSRKISRSRSSAWTLRPQVVVATDHTMDALVREAWDELLVARLFEVSLAPPSVADIRDDLPELAAHLLLHLVEAGEVPRRQFSTAA